MIAAPTPISVRVLKYDGAEHRRWNGRIARNDGSLIVLYCEFEEEVQHELFGNIPRGTQTIEYYWLDRWYNIFQFLDSAGKTRVLYCNVSTPPVLTDETLSYVDLDIDILVQANLSYHVLDLEEFEGHVVQFGYSDEVKSKAHAAVAELIKMIETRQFPFDERGGD
jgi:protein associated with RNAse G/E